MAKKKSEPEQPVAEEPEAFDAGDGKALVKSGSQGMRVGGEEVPEWLMKRGSEKKGLKELGKHQAIPRLQIIQSQSKKDRKTQFGEGSIVLFPDEQVVCVKDEVFIAIPLAFYTTFDRRSDFKDKNSDYILEETYDETSEIAQKARDRSRRREKYPTCDDSEPLFYSYVQNLNYIVLISSGEHEGRIATLTFNRGSFFDGERFAGFLFNRPFDIFGSRVEFSIKELTRADNDFYGFDFNNPRKEDGGAFVSEEQLPVLEEMHDRLMEKIALRKLDTHKETRDDVAHEAEWTPKDGEATEGLEELGERI